MDICYREINIFIKESTLFYWLTSFTLGGIFLFVFIQSSYSFFEKKRIPRGPLPSLPFGNIKDVIFKKENFNIHLWKYYNRFRRKKYYFAGLYILFKPIVMFVDPFLIYTALTDKEKFKNICDNTINWDLNVFKNTTILSELLKNINSFNECLIKKLAKATDVDTPLEEFYLQTSCCLIGIDREKWNTILPREKNTFWFYVSLCYNKLKIFEKFCSYKSQNKEHFKNVILDELKNRKKNDIKKMDMLNELEDAEQNVDVLYNLFSDGVEYGHNLTQFCLYELADNQEIQQELIGEIRRFGNENIKVTYENVGELKLLDAVIKETLRLYPPNATILKRSSTEFKNEKYQLNLPKDCLVAVSVFGIHHDASNFLNPEQFDPDRFCDESVKFLKACSFLPFGIDRKSEIEMKYITFQVKLGLICILSKYKVSLKSNTKLEFNANKLNLAPRNNLNFKFSPL